MLQKNSSIPFYIQIQKALLEDIHVGKVSIGDKIPSEQALAQQFGVSRMTARKAVNDLTVQGVLIRRQGKGTFVADHVLSYGLSSMLSFSRTLSALGHKVTTKVLQQEIIRSPAYVSEALRLRPNSDVILIRRLRYVDDFCAAIHSLYLDQRYRQILKADLSTESLLVTLEKLRTDTELYSIDKVRATLVDEKDAALLEISLGSPVLKVTGVTYNSSSNPVRYITAVYRGDFFDLVVKNTRDQTASISVADIPTELSETQVHKN